MRVIVSGSLAYDKIMDFPDAFANHILPEKIHVLSVSFLVTQLEQNFGGTAGNISYTLGLLGMKPAIFASAGKDFDDYKKWLIKKGVDTRNIKIVKNDNTATAYIITDNKNNQITAFYLGAMKHSAALIRKADLSKSFLGIVAPGNLEDMIRYCTEYKAALFPYIFDPGQQITALSKSQLNTCVSCAKVFISNDYELSLILEKTGMTKKQMLEKSEIIITTLGEKGSLVETKKEKIQIPSAKPIAVIDPTGAGDAYRAGFIAGLAKHYPLEKCAKMGALSAVYAIEKYGTQNHSFRYTEFKTRYQKSFGEKL